MSDIITRLLLKTNEFDANLNKSKQSVNDFQGSISGMAKTAGAGVAKFAGAIGLAVGAGEGFMKVVRGSQATSDKFDNVLNSCTSTVNSFFTSLSTGDFSAFNQGLSDIISKAYAASAALDQLGNTRMAYNYFGTKTQAEIAENSLTAMDKGLPKSERSKGFSGWKNALNDKKEYSGAMKTDALDALIKTVVEGTVLDANNVSLKDFEKITKLDLNNPTVRDKEKNKLEMNFSQYQAQFKDLENQRKGGGIVDWAFPESDGAKERVSQNLVIDKAQAKLNEQYKQSILYKKILDKWSDKELQGAFNLAGEYNKVNEELAVQERTYNKAFNKFGKEKDEPKGGKIKAKIEESPLSGSLAYFDAEISKKNKELSQATTTQARVAVQTTIDELEARKLNLKISVDKSVFGQTHLEKDNKESSQIEELENTVIVYDNLISKKKEELSTEISESTHRSIKSEIAKLESTATEFNNLISTKKTQLSSETSETVRASIESEIKELESTTTAFNALISTKQAELIEIASKSFTSPIQEEIKKLEATKINLQAEITVLKVEQGDKMKSGILDGYNNHRDDKGNKTDPDAFKNRKLPKYESPISKKDIKLNDEYNESLAAMGSIMGSLSGAFDGNTASVLQWGVSLLSTIGQAIPAIMSMIPAKKAEAAASEESAGAATLDAVAKTMEAHAGIPFAGIAIGLAGVASIIAVLSSMPKFANGGFVPGSSFAGDNVLARVNSGEMILNRGQQGNLFEMLNSGVYGGITAEMVNPSPHTPIGRNIILDESAREIKVSGTLRANGSVLETVLNNYTHKKSKVR